MNLYPVGLALEGATEGKRQGEQHRTRQRRDAIALDQLEQDAEYQNLNRRGRIALGAVMMSDGANLDPLNEFMRSFHGVGDDFGGVSRNEDGTFTLKAGGKDHKIKDADQLGMMVFSALEPGTYLKNKQAAEKAKADNYHRGLLTDENDNVMHVSPDNTATPVTVNGKSLRSKGKLGRGAGHAGSTEALIDRIASEFKVDFPTAFEIFKNSSSNPEEQLRKTYMALAESDRKNMVERSDEARMEEAVRITRQVRQSQTGGLAGRYRDRPGPGQMREFPTGGGLFDPSGMAGPITSAGMAASRGLTRATVQPNQSAATPMQSGGSGVSEKVNPYLKFRPQSDEGGDDWTDN